MATVPLPSATKTLAYASPTATTSPIPAATLMLMTPTPLARPHRIRVEDWQLIRADSPRICATCGPVETIVTSRPGLTIALIQVYSHAQGRTSARVLTDLSYAEELICEPRTPAGYCGYIFGQFHGDRVTISAELLEGQPHQLEYWITFQRWAAY